MTMTSPAGDNVEVALADATALDDLRPLWLALHHHHREVATFGPLLDDDAASWARRRARYEEALASARGILAVARIAGAPVGYAFALLHPGPDDTFEYEGDAYGELYTLSVAPEARGRGIGTRLVACVEAELARRGATVIEVAVMSGNRDAARLYRRLGFEPSEELMRRPISGSPARTDSP